MHDTSMSFCYVDSSNRKQYRDIVRQLCTDQSLLSLWNELPNLQLKLKEKFVNSPDIKHAFIIFRFTKSKTNKLLLDLKIFGVIDKGIFSSRFDFGRVRESTTDFPLSNEAKFEFTRFVDELDSSVHTDKVSVTKVINWW